MTESRAGRSELFETLLFCFDKDIDPEKYDELHSLVMQTTTFDNQTFAHRFKEFSGGRDPGIYSVEIYRKAE